VGDVSHLQEAKRNYARGRRERAAALQYLLEALTSPQNPIDGDQLNRMKLALFLFHPELTQLMNKIDRSHSHKRELRDALLVGLAMVALDRLLSDPVLSAETAQAPSHVLKLASGTSIKVGAIVPTN
jgi:hypothetical protein